MNDRQREIESLLPLPSAAFHILMALADDDRHGYAIIQDVAARTGGALKLSAGTLYRTIQRLLEQGLIVETRERPAPEDDDERRRYYRISALGTGLIVGDIRPMQHRPISCSPGTARRRRELITHRSRHH